MSAIEKIKTFGWFAARPSHWAAAAALMTNKLKADQDNAAWRSQASAWATRQVRLLAEALRALGYIGSVSGFETIVGKELMRRAQERADTCPVRMGGAGDMSLLYYACEAIAAKHVLETGVAYGWSSLAILTSLGKREGSLLTSVDMPYPKMGNSQWVGIVVPDELRKRWRLIREPDRHGIDKALKLHAGAIDLCHYDSDKSYYGRMWAYPRLWKALRPGGVLISDDIQDNLAFKQFTEALGVKPIVVESQGKYVGLCVKQGLAVFGPADEKNHS